MVLGPARFSIEEAFRQLSATDESISIPQRPEFKDPLLVSLQSVSLSRVIDEELERFYNPVGGVDLLSRVFRRAGKS
jgi:hypothetical protein